jgi:uncharacterized protein (TIGR02145 family)
MSIYPDKFKMIVFKNLFRVSGVIFLLILINSCVKELSLPKISTTDVTVISITSVTTGGIVNNDGGVSIISRGVCWGLSPDPTTANNKTTDGTGTGAFVSLLAELNSKSTYYARAYATYIVGTVYGEEIAFNIGDTNLALQVQDIEGNVYNSVIIGDQVWMGENLKTTKYNDGTPISLVNDGLIWESMTTPACWSHNNKTANTNVKYGALYNWYTVNTGKLCPQQWHVPSDSEWKVLEINLLMDQYEVEKIGWRGTNQGDVLKTNTGWHLPDYGTNKTGFSALPGGYINNSGGFVFLEINGNWWSSTEYFEENAYYRRLYNNESKVGRFNTFKTTGFSVRCIKD